MKNIIYSSLLKKITTKLFLIIFVLAGTLANAQTTFPDNVEDVPGAPVDDWILPFVLVSLVVGYFYIRKKITVFNS